jgi:DNA-binding MarR family transcriptional regulator
MSRKLEAKKRDRRRSGKPGPSLQPGKPEDHVGFLLKTLHLGLRQVLEVELREHRIPVSFAQVGAMFSLSLEPGLPGAQLARRANVSAQTMNTILRRLEADGFIARRPHPESRRADSWFLTEDGDTMLEQARTVGDAVFERVLSVFSPDEAEEFKRSLRRCIAALELPAESVPERPRPVRGRAPRGARRVAAPPPH